MKEQFSDECWKNGLRLDKSPSVHYQLLTETISRTLIPRPKSKPSVGLHYYRYRVSRQAWPGFKR
jgi:hypothetical protein